MNFEGGKGDQGASHFVAPNPPFGAVFTYYLDHELKSKKDQRAEAEKEPASRPAKVQFPGWDVVEAERRELDPKVVLVVKAADGSVIRRVEGPVQQGFHRVAWDLKYPTPNAVELVQPPAPPWGLPPSGLMAAPGSYSVTMYKIVDGKSEQLDGPRVFEVQPLRSGALPGATPEAVATFWREYESAVRTHSAMVIALAKMLQKIERIQQVVANSTADIGDLDDRVTALRTTLLDLDLQLNGNRSKQEPGEKFRPIINDRLFAVSRGVDRSTYGPTATHRRMLEIANEQIAVVHDQLTQAQTSLTSLVKDLIASGAPWLEGEPLATIGGDAAAK